jgi:cytoskeletal protein RodZ
MPKWMRVLGIVGGAVFGVWFIVGLINAPSPAPSIQQQTIADVQKHVNDFHDAQAAITASTITVSTSDFDSMFDALEAPPAIDEPPLPAEAIAPEAAEPVMIEKATPQGNRSYSTTLGRVYQDATPEIRQEMAKIDHGYDHPDPHDCFVNHCLSPHKDFTVTADFDSGGKQTAHIHY